MKLVDGRYVNDRLATYLIPTSLDAPRLRSILIEKPFSGAPHGAKGVGELPMDVGAPAVVAAIHDATGMWIHDLPATPERILAALSGGAPPAAPGVSLEEPSPSTAIEDLPAAMRCLPRPRIRRSTMTPGPTFERVMYVGLSHDANAVPPGRRFETERETSRISAALGLDELSASAAVRMPLRHPRTTATLQQFRTARPCRVRRRWKS